jgi:TPR repeat protein
MRGEGVEKDPDQAVWWMGRAAAQGDVEAQYQVGVWLGLLGRSDEAEAWVRRAAEAGHDLARQWHQTHTPS